MTFLCYSSLSLAFTHNAYFILSSLFPLPPPLPPHSSCQEERFRKAAANKDTRVSVDGIGDGILSFYGKVGSKGEKRCGISLDEAIGKTSGL